MKIAYLITTYNNPLHLNRLIESIRTSQTDIFIHIDKKSKTNFNIPKYDNVFILENNLKVYWGSFTFIKAVLRLIEESYKKGNYDYYILLSGGCYPIKSNNYIQKFITKNRTNEFINMVKMPNNNKLFDRVDYYFMSKYEKNLNPVYILERVINLAIRKLKIKRKYPKEYKHLTLYGGSTWWAMSGNCVKYVTNYVKKNPKLVEFYENTLIPEEMFFQTVVGNSKYKEHVKNTFTYTDWPTQNLAHPVEISEKHIPILAKRNIQSTDGKQEDILFARKFSDSSDKVVKLINSKLRRD